MSDVVTIEDIIKTLEGLVGSQGNLQVWSRSKDGTNKTISPYQKGDELELFDLFLRPDDSNESCVTM